MNKFQTNKLGEALAFARLGQIFFDRTQTVLSDHLNTDQVNDELEKQTQLIPDLLTDPDHREAVETKAQATVEKLAAMQDLYLKKEDDWQNPAELMEWLGFFLGAAFVHWQLAEGIMSGLGTAQITTQPSRHYLEWLQQVGQSITVLEN